MQDAAPEGPGADEADSVLEDHAANHDHGESGAQDGPEVEVEVDIEVEAEPEVRPAPDQRPPRSSPTNCRTTTPVPPRELTCRIAKIEAQKRRRTRAVRRKRRRGRSSQLPRLNTEPRVRSGRAAGRGDQRIDDWRSSLRRVSARTRAAKVGIAIIALGGGVIPLLLGSAANGIPVRVGPTVSLLPQIAATTSAVADPGSTPWSSTSVIDVTTDSTGAVTYERRPLERPCGMFR